MKWGSHKLLGQWCQMVQLHIGEYVALFNLLAGYED